MKHDDDPPRLFEPGSGAPPALGELFRSARADLPAPAELAALRARVDGAIAPSPASPPALGFRAKAGLGLAAGVIGVGALLWLVWPQSRDASEAARAPAASPPFDSPPAERGAPVAMPPGIPTAAPPAPPEAERAAPPAPAEKTGAARRRADTESVARSLDEAALLERARAALATNPARALALTREHARRYPQGMLAQEREVIAIEALRRGGDGRAADERAREFQREYPGSPHRRSVEPAPR